MTGARTRLSIFDLDKTLTIRPTWTLFLLFVLRRRGRLLAGAPRLAGMMLRWLARRNGREALKNAGMKIVMSGMTPGELDRAAEDFVDRLIENGLRPGARATLSRVDREGRRTMIATASVDIYARILADRLGMDELICTRTIWPEGAAAPQIDGTNCLAAEKMRQVLAAYGPQRDAAHIEFYSDHYSDLELLLWVDCGVAVNPDARLTREAKKHGLTIADWMKETGPHVQHGDHS